MPPETSKPRHSLAIGLITGILALAFGWLGLPIFVLICTLFSVSFLATWIHASYLWRSRLGTLPRWLSRMEMARAYLADEDFEPATKGP